MLTLAGYSCSLYIRLLKGVDVASKAGLFKGFILTCSGAGFQQGLKGQQGSKMDNDYVEVHVYQKVLLVYSLKVNRGQKW